MLTPEQVRALAEQMEPSPVDASPSDLIATVHAIRRVLDDLEAGRMGAVIGLTLIQHHAFRRLPPETQFFGLHELLPDVEREVMDRYRDRLPAHLRALP